MLLCDIGNSSFAFYDQGRVTTHLVKDFDIDSVRSDVYYICVNPEVSEILKSHPLWHDLKPMIKLTGSYETLGVDRQVAVLGLEGDGVVVDAGSAITVDIVTDGSYQGGFIYPGFRAMQQAFAQISSKLDYLLNFEVTLDKIATNSQDAISYGAIAPIVTQIKQLSEDKRLILTGGDAPLLAKHLKNASLQPHWLFHAMGKIMNSHKG